MIVQRVQKKILAFALCLMASSYTIAQRLDWKAFRITEENEFFNVTQRGIDRYYTQGLRFEFLYKATERKLLERLMIPASPSAINNYSASITQQIYTPIRTYSYFFVGDMPYSGALFLSEALQSTDSTKRLRMTSKLDVGFIGPSALGQNTQLLFHKLINNDLAVGWVTQMRHDVYLDYSLKAERAITKKNNFVQLEGKGELNFGTVLISVVPGINFASKKWCGRSGKFSFNVFVRPEIRLVFFNAILQGGILNQANADEFYSRYFIKKIKPFVYSHSVGFEMRYNRMELLYRQVNLTREFPGQDPHYYGTVMLTFPFN
jgi:lipid A 3-O-deacylase